MMDYWVVMIPQRFENLKLYSESPSLFRLALSEEPYRYLPVFESLEEAVAWNGGSTEHISQCRTVEEKP